MLRRKPAKSLKGIGGILRPRREAANLLSEALRDGRAACSPYTHFLTPKIADALWAPQDPIRRRAVEPERHCRRRNSAETAFLNTGQLALHYLRYIVAGEITLAWEALGGMTAIPPNHAHPW